MLDQSSGIVAHVVRHCGKLVYQEYADVNIVTQLTGGGNFRYLEAVTDERFSIVVIVPPGPALRKGEWAQICVELEGGRRIIKKTLKTLEPETTAHVFDGMRVFDGLYWRNHRMVFGEIQSGAPTLDDDRLSEEKKSRGTISITVKTGYPKWEEEAVAPALYALFASSEVLEHKSHGLKSATHINPHCGGPRQGVVLVPYTGDDAVVELASFKFCYVSRAILIGRGITPNEQAPAVTVDASDTPSGQPTEQAVRRDSLEPTQRSALPLKRSATTTDLSEDESGPSRKQSKAGAAPSTPRQPGSNPRRFAVTFERDPKPTQPASNPKRFNVCFERDSKTTPAAPDPILSEGRSGPHSGAEISRTAVVLSGSSEETGAGTPVTKQAATDSARADVGATDKTATPAAAQKEKEKKRLMLMLEENKIMQRLMELEEDIA
ncbi:uncharacterized protein LTR77_010519 [Saxophila tyrrhenica]|uniref:DUF7918 domain-containing protein n=1 Tax=Saxophila tyrrhenica TaxID=1690608 RepID=A0AAV9NV07_9PEZI|nr:hypothetical protein LTR77_010519 [Saxophila tyrrhenica]